MMHYLSKYLEIAKKYWEIIKEQTLVLNLQKLKSIILFEKYKNFKNLRKLAKILSYTSINSNIFFYIWIFSNIYININSLIVPLLSISIVLNVYVACLFIKWLSPYENTKLTLWAWISLIFISPSGWMMWWLSRNDKYWNLDPQVIHTKGRSIMHLFFNSFSDLDKNLKDSINYLSTKYPLEYKQFVDKILRPKNQNFDEWGNREKYFVLALALSLKQNKKSSFHDVMFSPHWYDEKSFDFALKNNKAEITIVRYPYLIAFLIVDEFDNYQKIVNAKKEIKKNLRFSPARVICLHWGKGYKVYVNG